jgi:hypothetical protein
MMAMSKATIFFLIAVLQTMKHDGTKLEGYMLYPQQFTNESECSSYVRKNNRKLTSELMQKLDKDYIKNRKQPIWIPRSFLCINEKEYNFRFNSMKI